MFKKLKASPINYFSDLFLAVMVIGWVCSLPFVGVLSVIALLKLQDTTVVQYFVQLVEIPLTTGGAIWLIKCSVQHAIASKHGKKCDYDFPSVDTGDSGEKEEEENETEEPDGEVGE